MRSLLPRSHPCISSLRNVQCSTLLSLSCVFSLLSCGGGDAGSGTTTSPTNPGAATPVAAVKIVPDSAFVQPARAFTFTAIARDAADKVLTGRVVTWSSTDTTVATVSALGEVTGRREGSATITALAEGRIGGATIVVRSVLASIALSTTSVTVVLGQQASLTATPKDSSGTTLAGRTLSWTSGDTSVARVSSSGVITAHRVGRTTITVTSEGRSAIAAVEVVLPVAARVTLMLPYPQLVVGMSEVPTAVAYDGAGSPIAQAPIVLSSSDNNVARIDSAGRLRVFGSGSATITATSGSARATATVSAVLASTASEFAATAHVTEVFPAVIDSTGMAGVDLLYDGPSTVTAVELETYPNTIPLVRIAGTNRWVVTLSAARTREMVQTCGCGNGYFVIGYVRAMAGSSVLATKSATVNVRRSTEVPVTAIDARMQATTHVVNIRMDSSEAEPTHTPIIQRVYDRYGDSFDFVVSAHTARFGANLYADVKQFNVYGVGLCCYNGLGLVGRPGLRRLLSFINIPTWKTLADGALAHEVGHTFMVGPTPIRSGSVPWAAGHFALGSMALGIMGNGAPNTGYMLTPTGPDSWRLDTASPHRVPGFLDVELYFMGLVPIDSVGPHFVFRNQAQSFSAGATLAGPVDTVRNTDIVRILGARSPAWPNTQRAFTAARVIVSRGRLLSSAEMAYFDQDARDAEGRSPIVRPGGSSSPFYLQTGGRATLQFRLP